MPLSGGKSVPEVLDSTVGRKPGVADALPQQALLGAGRRQGHAVCHKP